jgi:phenylalanine-4-hydroxylase
VKAATKEDKLKIANNWWYGIEFSFIKEDGVLKALGTGLVSSEGELNHALSDKVEKLPFDWDVIGKIDRSAHEFHTKLFVLENLKQLEDAVDKLL